MNKIITYLFIVLIAFACNKKNEQKNVQSIVENDINNKLSKISQQIKSNPTASSFAQRALIYYEMKEYALSLDDANQAIKLDSTNGEWYFMAAKALRKQARINNSIKAAITATQFGYESGELYLLLGENYLIFRQYQAAIDNLNEAMRMDRFNEKIYFYKGLVYKETNQLKDAESSFQTSIEINPNYSEAYNQLISIALEKQNFILAQQYIESGLRFVPNDPYLWFNYGVSLQTQGLLDSSIAPYLNSFSYDSSLTIAAFNLGWVYYNLGKYELSLKKFERVLKIEPNNVSALYMKSLNLFEKGEKENALNFVKKALLINPDYTEAKEFYNKIKD